VFATCAISWPAVCSSSERTPTDSGRIANMVRSQAADDRSAVAVSSSPWRTGSGSSSASIRQVTWRPVRGSAW
jgi:hypothetical protein